MASRAARSAAKEQYWCEVIGGWRRIGGSVRQWCLQRQISEPSFYSWRRVLAAQDAGAVDPERGDKVACRNVSSSAMLPVEIVSPASGRARSSGGGLLPATNGCETLQCQSSHAGPFKKMGANSRERLYGRGIIPGALPRQGR